LSSRLHSKPLRIKIYKIIILPVVLYGCGTWSVTLREGHRLRVFENRVLRRIFGPKREEVVGGWRRLHNEEFNNLYVSPNNIRVLKSRELGWAEHVQRMGVLRNAQKISVGNLEGKKALGNPRRR
jgi:hypothetical protein